MLGKGTFGIVREAVHRRTGTAVAIKKLTYKVDKYVNIEVNSLLRLRGGPHIIAFLGLAKDDASFHLVFELAGEDDFDDLLPRLTARDASMYTRQLCKALEFAHARSVIHRDVKPENIVRFLLS